MKYHVVLTVDEKNNNNLCLTIIPDNWKEKNFIYYPKNANLAKKMVRSAFTPDKNKWKKFSYSLKQTFSSFDEAEKAVQEMEDASTDDESIKKQLKNTQMRLNEKEIIEKGASQSTLNNTAAFKFQKKTINSECKLKIQNY